MRSISFFYFVLILLLTGCEKKVAPTPTAPIPGINGTVNALNVYNGSLIAGGQFTKANNVNANNIAQWNGTVWSALGTGLNNVVSALINYNGNLIAGCNSTGIFEWNGNSWSQIALTTSPSYVFTIYNNHLVAAGIFDSIGGIKATGLAQWNGSVWATIDSETYTGIIGLATYEGNLIACGNNTNGGGLKINGKNYDDLAKWNGVTWSGIGSRIYYQAIYSDSNYLYAGGMFFFGFYQDTTWNSLGSALYYPQTQPSVSQISVIGLCNKSIFVADSWYGYHDGPGQNIEQMNGNSFTTIGTITQSSEVNCMIQYNNSLVTGGSFSSISNTSVMNIAQWNGVSWSAF